jgi:LysM repeat protein
VLPRLWFAQLLRFVLLICAFLALGPGYAEAEEGLASWYGPGLEGKATASGVPYDPSGYTAASRTLPLGTKLLVSYGQRTVPVTVNDRGPLVAGRDLDLSQEATQALGLPKAGVDEVDWRLADSNLPQELASQELGTQQGLALQQLDPAQEAGQPLEHRKIGIGEVEEWSFANPRLPQGTAASQLGTPQGMVQRPDLPQEGAQQPDLTRGVVQQPNPSQGTMQDVAGRGDYLVQPGDTLSDIASRLGTSVDDLARSNGIADPNIIQGGKVLHLYQPNSIDPNFIRGQEGFRLDGYVPDPQSSMSGVTVGTGVDIGQMSAADIWTLDIPQELKQKLVPYAGVIGQNAVNFLHNHPLHLTQDEANALDRLVTQNTVERLADRFNSGATSNSFTDLPPTARMAITDIAYQYGPNLAQRMPDFWSDVTAGRWNSVIQKLRNFGDRYPVRRNAEADLLQGLIQPGDFRHYVAQSGDTLPEIASRLGTSVDHLVRSNGIADPNTIYSGQVLYY